MSSYLNRNYDLTNQELISVLDETPFWSAPFGLKLLDTVKYRKNLAVLDIGFGLGFPLTELAMRLGNSSHVYGIDPWETAFERTLLKLQIYNLKNVTLTKGFAEEMPYADSFFDLIVSNNGLNNVSDLEKTFKECQRISKKGAQFVFTFNASSTFKAFYDIFKEILKKRGYPEIIQKIEEHINIKRPSIDKIRMYLDNFGFEETSLEESFFEYKFADAPAVFNHFLINLAFLPSWKNFTDENILNSIFNEIENKIESVISKCNAFSMGVPFYVMNCIKI